MARGDTAPPTLQPIDMTPLEGFLWPRFLVPLLMPFIVQKRISILFLQG